MHRFTPFVVILAFSSISVSSPLFSRQQTFAHPGIFISQAQLSFTKSKLASKSEPWISAYSTMDSVSWAKISWTASPIATVRCEDPGTPEYSQEQGCEEERNDALAAYSMALRWAYTGNNTYAQKAISIIDTWSKVLKGHVSTSSPEQVGLQSGWVAGVWTRAAEIVRYTDAGWSESSISAFETMLKDVYLPQVRNGSAANPNNIDSAKLEAAKSIAIFLDDRELYDSVMARFKQHVPSYIYLESDGAYPKIPEWTTNYLTEARVRALWQNDESYFNGRTQESCRDLEHASYGLASISHMMETAWIQGDDLYVTELGTRLQAALEVHAPYASGVSAPSWFCAGSLKYTLLPVAEPAYNAVANRMGRNMPDTEAFVNATRPVKSNSLFTAWETLTHAENY